MVSCRSFDVVLGQGKLREGRHSGKARCRERTTWNEAEMGYALTSMVASTCSLILEIVVEIELRLPSMLHGKKGFDRIVYAFKNVLNTPVTWLFCDLRATGWITSLERTDS
jgi:hypothetical protein